MSIAELIAQIKPIALVALGCLALFLFLPALTVPLTMTMAESTPLAFGVIALLLLLVMRRTLARR